MCHIGTVLRNRTPPAYLDLSRPISTYLNLSRPYYFSFRLRSQNPLPPKKIACLRFAAVQLRRDAKRFVLPMLRHHSIAALTWRFNSSESYSYELLAFCLGNEDITLHNFRYSVRHRGGFQTGGAALPPGNRAQVHREQRSARRRGSVGRGCD